MHGQWWSKFSRSFKGFEIYVLYLQCRFIFLHFYSHLAYQCYHISASTSKIQAPVVWHHPWVLENALKSHVNISLIYPQKWWSMGSRSLCGPALYPSYVQETLVTETPGKVLLAMQWLIHFSASIIKRMVNFDRIILFRQHDVACDLCVRLCSNITKSRQKGIQYKDKHFLKKTNLE